MGGPTLGQMKLHQLKSHTRSIEIMHSISTLLKKMSENYYFLLEITKLKLPEIS